MSSQFTFGDIPDTVPNKYYYPMSKNIWKIHQQLGWDYLELRLNLMVDNFYD